jgi:raffinose/stachyose/melibiose transport system permease protein
VAMTRRPSRYAGHRRRKAFQPMFDAGGALTPYLYVGPTVAFVLVFLIIPLASVVWYSLVSWSGLGRMVFVGLGNFLSLFRDEKFWSSLSTNLVYVLFFSLIPTAFGLLLAALMGGNRIPGDRFFRAVLLMPQVVASVAMGVIFGWIFAPGFGVLNGLLRAVGLERLERPWLGDVVLAPIAVGVVGTWLWLGFVIVIFSAGIQKIEQALFDAAKIDGAGPWKQFTAITFPSLRAELVVVIVVTLIRAFGSGVFGIVAAITAGSYKTTPLALYAYRLAFVESRMGYGSAVVILLMVLIIILSGVTYGLGERRKE